MGAACTGSLSGEFERPAASPRRRRDLSLRGCLDAESQASRLQLAACKRPYPDRLTDAVAGVAVPIADVEDPYACNTKPATGLTGSTTGLASVYRRALPSANLGFLSTIMWDGREPDLFSQAIDATLGH